MTYLSKSAYSKGSRGSVKIFGRTPSCAAWLISAAVVAGLLSVVSTATPAVCGKRARPQPFLPCRTDSVRPLQALPKQRMSFSGVN